MSTTRITRRIAAPPERVYRALVDAGAVAQWMVPDGMTSQVHGYDPREGGAFRISLTYEAQDAVGKTSAHSDTYQGHFVELLPGRRVVQAMEFESEDPAMRGEMRVSFQLEPVEGGTKLRALHESVPPGVSPQDNETGWRMALEKLAALVERRED
jgi:uncharacterized protein YndB with AHSA1/START domain